MKYQFRPYATMQPTEVTLTGNVYEKGEHPTYTEHKIIEVVDEQGEVHYAFEDELTSDEVKKQERIYSELGLFISELKDRIDSFEYSINQKSYISEYVTEWFKQFKKIKL